MAWWHRTLGLLPRLPERVEIFSVEVGVGAGTGEKGMIRVTRLDGSRVVVNAELIETIEAVPETLIVLVTRRRIMVRETVEEIIEQVLEYRRSVATLPDVLRGQVPLGSPEHDA